MPPQSHAPSPLRLPARPPPRWSRRWAPLVFALLIGLVPLFPSLALTYVTDRWAGIAAAAVCLALLSMGVSVRERPSWVRILAVPYWILAFLVQIPLAVLGAQISSTFLLAAVAFALAVFLPLNWRRLGRWVLLPSLAVLAVTGAWELWDRSRLAASLVAASAPGVMLLALWLARQGMFYATRRIALGLCVFTGLVSAKAYLVYMVHKPMAIEKVLAQPGIRAIYDYRSEPYDRQIPPQAMFMARVPNRDLYVVGPHDPYSEVLLIEPGGSPRIWRIPIDGRGGDMAIFHADEPGVFVMAGRSHLYRIGVDPPGVVESVPLGEKKLPLNMVRYDPTNRRYYIVRAYDSEAYVVEREPFRLARTLRSPPGSCYNDAWIDRESNSLILLGDYALGGQICVHDLASLDLRARIQLPHEPLTLAAPDTQGRRLFIATLLGNRVLAMNMDTLEVRRALDLPQPVRNLNFDPDRRLLIGGGFSAGLLLLYDVDNGTWAGKIFLGKLVRWVEVDQGERKWYANSSAGGFEIDPDLVLSTLHGEVGGP